MAEKQITIFDSTESLHQDYKIKVDELQENLTKFNLTPNQSKVYIFLGKYGSKTAPEVCKALKIARTETYHLLSTLQSRGIVSATFEHPIKFSALPVAKAMKTLVNSEKERIRSLEEQEKDIMSIWEKIPNFLTNESDRQEDKFQMLQGINPIKSKLSEMLDSTENEILLVGTEKDHLRLYHSNDFNKINKKNVNIKILTTCTDKTSYVFDEIKNKEMKQISKDMDKKTCFVIKDKKEIIFYTKNNHDRPDESSAMWTDSSAMISSLELLFQLMWKSSKLI